MYRNIRRLIIIIMSCWNFYDSTLTWGCMKELKDGGKEISLVMSFNPCGWSGWLGGNLKACDIIRLNGRWQEEGGMEPDSLGWRQWCGV